MVGFGIGDHAYVGSGTSGINYADFWEYNNNYVEPEPMDTNETTGIHTLDKNFAVNISPNPFTTSTTIKIQTENQLKDLRFLLYDLTGKEIKQLNNIEGDFILRRENLSSGI